MSTQNSGAKTPMTPAAASRIQSATARQSGGHVSKSTFAARAQRTAARAQSAAGRGGKK